MMLRSLAQLRSKVVFEADLPPPTADTTPALADLNARINEGVAEFHRIVVTAAADTAYYKEWTFTTQIGTQGNGQTDYQLPTDFYQLKQVRSQINGQDWRDLGLYTAAEEAYYLSATPGFSGEPNKYRLIGKSASDGSDAGKIRVVPPPCQNIQIKLEYIFGPPVLVLDTDQIDGFAGYEDYAIQFAIASCCRKIEEYEKSDRASAEMMRLKADFLADMRKRDADRPPRVQMTRDQWSGRRRRPSGGIGG